MECLFNKVAGLSACDFIKKRLHHRSFPVKFATFLGIPFFTEHLRTTVSDLSPLIHTNTLNLRGFFYLRRKVGQLFIKYLQL